MDEKCNAKMPLSMPIPSSKQEVKTKLIHGSDMPKTKHVLF
jgi:hypothetical protein